MQHLVQLLPRIFALRFIASFFVVCSLAIAGCHLVSPRNAQLPHQRIIERERLIVHTDFFLPRGHALLDELVQRQQDIAMDLALPPCDTPVTVYLFDDESSFTKYMRQKHPLLPDRRAFFVRNDTDLMVFAWWGDRIAEDLRHEVTHGYLHSQLPDLPLWLDEGLAEYYETPPSNAGFSSPHVHLLLDQLDRGEWQPDLKRLESITRASSLTLMDYAESWLWVHWMLHDPAGGKLLQQHVADQVAGRNAGTTQ